MPRISAAERAGREIAGLTLLCAVVLSPLGLLARTRSPEPKAAPLPLWMEAPRFIPTSFSPEVAGVGRHVAAIHDSSKAPSSPPVVLLDMRTGEVLRRLNVDRPDGARIRLLSFSEDEKRLYVLWSVESAPRYTTVDCFNWRTGQRVRRVVFNIYGETGSFYPERSLNINGDSVDTGRCNTLYVHNARDGHLVTKRTLEELPSVVWANCSQDATTVAATSGNHVLLLDLSTLKVQARYEHPEKITITHSWPGNKFAVVDSHGMTLVNGKTGKVLHRYEGGQGNDKLPPPHFTAFESTPDGKVIFGMDSNRVYVWRHGRLEPPLTLRGNGSGSPFAFRVAGQGQYLMVPETIPSTPGLRVWDVSPLTGVSKDL